MTHPIQALLDDSAAAPWPLDRLREPLAERGLDLDITTVGGPPPRTAPEVLHVVGPNALAVAHDGGVPTVVTVSDRTPLPTDEDGALVDPGSDIAAYVVTSEDGLRRLVQAGVPRDRCFVVPPAVDLEVFGRTGPAANRTERARVVAEAGCAGDGVLDAVHALEQVRDAELLVLTPVPRESVSDVPHLREMEEAAVNAGVRDRVAFRSPADAGERAWLLRSADVVVSTPLVSGSPRLVVEAMACGRPVVATPVGEARDLVVHGVTGMHVTAGDGRALTAALRSLVSDAFLRDGLGSAGADRARSRYGWDRVAQALSRAYDSALASGDAVHALAAAGDAV